MFDNSGQSPEPGLIDYRTVNRALHELDQPPARKKLHGLDNLAGILNQPLPSASSPSPENPRPIGFFRKYDDAAYFQSVEAAS